MLLQSQALTNNHENSEKEGLLTLFSELREVIIRTEKIGNLTNIYT